MNAFEAYSGAVKPAWQERQERAAQKRLETMKRRGTAPMVDAPAEAALKARDRLVAAYRVEKRKRTEDMLQSSIGPDLSRLLSELRRLKLTQESAEGLVKYIEGANWLRAAPRTTRLDVLNIIAAAIARLREREGYPPFDDSVFDEPPTAFDRIRDLIGEHAQ